MGFYIILFSWGPNRFDEDIDSTHTEMMSRRYRMQQRRTDDNTIDEETTTLDETMTVFDEET